MAELLSIRSSIDNIDATPGLSSLTERFKATQKVGFLKAPTHRLPAGDPGT